MLKGLFSSLSGDYATPKELLRTLEEEFGKFFDPCPLHNPDNIDGLSIEWKNPTFVNPPYGREIGKWVKKGYEEARRGNTVVMLLPSRTDTVWWHEYVMKAREIRFIKGRLRFGNAVNSAPFPSAIAVFKKV